MELFSVSILSLGFGLIAGVWLVVKKIAPKTQAQWDDSIVDMIEGVCSTLDVDPDELAKKSLGRLKPKIIKKT